jgi:hypothetical protein
MSWQVITPGGRTGLAPRRRAAPRQRRRCTNVPRAAPIIFVLAGVLLTHGPLAVLSVTPAPELVKAADRVSGGDGLDRQARRGRREDLSLFSAAITTENRDKS